MRGMLILPLLLVPLAACDPVTPRAAEAVCYPEAQQATRPFNDIRFGPGATPAPGSAGLPVGHARDYPPGGSPEEVWTRCITDLSTRPPERSFASVPRGSQPPVQPGTFQ